jgi:hypothetical protein
MKPQRRLPHKLEFPVCTEFCAEFCLPLIEDPPLYIACWVICYELCMNP